MKTGEIIKDELNRIMGITYVSPHAPNFDNKIKFSSPRCEDCFCTDQSLHTHSADWYLKLREDILAFIERL